MRDVSVAMMLMAPERVAARRSATLDRDILTIGEAVALEDVRSMGLAMVKSASSRGRSDGRESLLLSRCGRKQTKRGSCDAPTEARAMAHEKVSQTTLSRYCRQQQQ